MSYQDEVAVVIPAYNPDEKLLSLIDKLCEAQFQYIVILDDGSSFDCKNIFAALASCQNCRLLRHFVNLGKGRALKDAFNFVLNKYPLCKGAVTVDADGQHRPEDVVRCAQALLESPGSLVMGCRDFENGNVPSRSRFGNKLTRRVLSALCGVRVSDTQTGLRGIPADLMPAFLSVKGERFEYETNMLIETKNMGCGIVEVPIETVYIEENKSSHFNPVRDSLKIYAVFGKFVVSALLSSLIDITVFTILVALLKSSFPAYYIIIATALARVISSLFNFTLNKKHVFRSKNTSPKVFIKYYSLCIVQLALSAIGVHYLYDLLPAGETLCKIVVDTVLFFISFIVQREWVFKNAGRAA